MSKAFIPVEPADITWKKDLPFSNQYQDVYYARKRSIKQNAYVYIEGNDLIKRWVNLSSNHSVFTIGETGFGTGLNFLLTLRAWIQSAPESATLHYISCEKHPFKAQDLNRALSNWTELNALREELIKQYPLLTPGNHHLFFCEGRVKLTLMFGEAYECFEQLLICGVSSLESQLRTCFIDAWYLTSFSPKKNEEIGTKSILKVVTMLSKKGTTFATFMAASQVTLALNECGFEIIKKKGCGFKSHILTGFLKNTTLLRIKHRSTPWHVAATKLHKEKTALIVGGGLAGCFSAYSLAERGWEVTLIEEANALGEGASANRGAVLFPKLSSFRSPLTEFMLVSFIYAHQFYSNLLKKNPIGELNGAITLPFNEKEKKSQANLAAWLSVYPELGKLISAELATTLAGIKINMDCLHIPYSGWIDSPALCAHLVTSERINIVTNTKMNSLVKEDNQWRVKDFKASILILANGYQLNQFEETRHLPIKPIRGQMTAIESTKDTEGLKIPVCAEGHVLPLINGSHYLGATYDLGNSQAQVQCADDKSNLEKLRELSEQTKWSEKIIDRWAGIRATTPDYLPLIGPIAQASEFLRTYQGLETNAKRWIPKEAPTYSGLYAFAGFGSRGLTTVPLAAEWLSALINTEINGASRHLMQSLSPSRFLKRAIARGI